MKIGSASRLLARSLELRPLGASDSAFPALRSLTSSGTQIEGSPASPVTSEKPNGVARFTGAGEGPNTAKRLNLSRGFSSAGVARQSEPQPSEEPERESSGNAPGADPFLDGITTRAGPAAYYKEHRLSGLYKKDPRQEGTILKLQELYDSLLNAFVKGRRRRSGLTVVDHSGVTEDHATWWQGISSFLTDRAKGPEQPQPSSARGLYMYGGVGTGKTMLMDLLVNSAPPQFKLRRVHFHDFMLEIHGKLRQFANQEDPLLKVADSVASCTRVLCLDELFVTDVADAAILNRLFGRLWDKGVVLVATSNRDPDELYKGGLQRELFLPFIERLKTETEVHDMASPVDYRKLAQHRNGIYFTGPDSDQRLASHFADLVATAGGRPPAPQTVPVQMGRTLRLPLAGANMCFTTFTDLCGGNLGAADYLALAGEFHTLALSGVPVFDARTRPHAYRFVTLVDVLYEHRIRLFCSAAAPPLELFSKVLSQEEARSAKGSAKELDALIVDDNLAFSKDRTISRLTEMESSEYLLAHARRHAPCLVLALEEQEDPRRIKRPLLQQLAA